MGVKEKSFSLIEMVIVIAVIGLVLPILFAIVFLIIQQQIRIYSLQEIKRQGDNALLSMRSTIKQYGAIVTNPTVIPAPTISDICPVYPDPTLTPMPFIYLYNEDSASFYYSIASGVSEKIASNSAENNITNLLLTNDNVNITDLEFNCYKSNQFSPAIVSVYFRVTKAGTDPNPPYMDYSTKFQLRNY